MSVKSSWSDLTKSNSTFTNSYFDYAKNSAGIFKRSEINLYDNIYRFGMLDPYNVLQDTREYLFFTKPDLHIMDGKTGNLNSQLSSQPYFIELKNKYPKVIYQLQKSADPNNNPLSLLLSNNVTSTLDVPSMSANTIDTSANVFGTSYEYRGSSEASDDNFDFSLEFRDNKYLDVYNYFKAYEEYQTLKSHGIVSPEKSYITKKILHDQIGIFKFLVDVDYETIIYYAYYCGVMYKSLPRDVFSNNSFDGGLSFSIDMKAAFVEDMNPLIISDFNTLTANYRSKKTSIDAKIFDTNYGIMDGHPVKCAYISESADSTGRKRYRLKWRR